METTGALIGRGAEIARLSSFIDDASDAPSACVISGEPGIGKTAVWTEGLRQARERSVRVLVARPAEADLHVSFGALDDVFREALPEVLPSLPRPQQRALAVALLLEDPEGPPPDLRSVAVASRAMLQAMAREGPVLIGIDDTQWLDAPSVLVLAHALRRISSGPVRLLMTVRGADLPPSDLARALPLERCQHMALGPLTLGAMHRLVVDRFGRGLPRPTLVRIHETSAGNPFFAIEIARALLLDGARVRPGDPLPIPHDLLGLLRMRLQGLPADTQEVLAVVALLSDRSVEMIQRAAPQHGAALQAAIDADVLDVEGDRVRFTHPLLASAVLSRLLPDALRSLHRRIAAVVTDPEDRARHLALGAESPDDAVAASLDGAAGHAMRRGAPGVAGELEELAARMTPNANVHARRRRILDAARHRMVSGEMDHARETAAALLGEPLTPGERADTLVLLARASMDDIGRSLALAEEAAIEARKDPRPSVETYIALSEARTVRGDIQTAAVDARRALELAEEEGNPVQIAMALSNVAQAELWTCSVTPGLLDRALALEREVGGLFAYDSPTFVSAWSLMCADQLDEARVRFRECLRRAAAAGNEVARAAVLLHLSELESRAGNWGEARRLALDQLEAGEQIGEDQQPGAGSYPLALADAYLGRVEEARAEAEAGIAASEAILDEVFRFQNLSVLGFLELSIGNLAAADEILRPLADTLEELGWAEPSVFRVLPNAIEALVGLGELDEARRLLDRLKTRGEQASSRWSLACAGRCRGLVLAAEGDLAGATDALEGALEVHGRFPEPFERARTLLALGLCQRRARRKAVARRQIQEARGAFRALGARLWADRAEEELQRIGGRAPSPLELTPTERQVASLVSEGLSNREVADRLFVSVRTVEGHLSSVYRKLGVRSRTALASRLPLLWPDEERAGTNSSAD